MNLFILIDLENGQTHISQFPNDLGICAECDDICPPGSHQCNNCHAEMITNGEVRMLEELLANTDIVLP